MVEIVNFGPEPMARTATLKRSRTNKSKKSPDVGTELLEAAAFKTITIMNRIDLERIPTPKDMKKVASLLKQGSRYALNGKPDKASECYLHAHALEPSNALTLLVLGNNLRNAKQVQPAILAMERALKIAGDQLDIIHGVALLATDLKMISAAENMYALMIHKNPDDSRGSLGLAGLKRQQGKYEEAIDILQFAIQNNQTDAGLWHGVATVVAEQRGVDAAVTFYEESLRLDPNFSVAVSNLGMAYSAEGRFDEALPWMQKAAKMRPDDPDTHFNLSAALLGTGDLENGWQEYEWRLDKRRSEALIFVHDVPRWDGEDLTDKTILVCDEQGIGDAIIFSSVLNELIEKAGHVIVDVDYRLVDWFQRSFPEATVHRHVTVRSNGRPHRHYHWLKDEKLPKPDYHIQSGSLFARFRPTMESFDNPKAHLKPDPERVAFWKERFDALGPGPKVGLCWSGGYVTPVRAKGYMSLSDMEPLWDLADKGAIFIDCMYKDASEDRAQLEAEKGVKVHDWDDIDRRLELDEAAAYTAALDYVISISSSPVAIGAAQGLPTATMLHKADRLFFGTGKELWFEKSDLFIAENQADWPHGPLARARKRAGEVLFGE